MADEFVTDVAVVLGIGDYNRAVGHLETPVRDAKAVANLLKTRFGYEVILRCDGEATLTGLRTLLRDELPEQVPAGSRLLFYFAGHGVALDSTELEGPQGYLVPRDADRSVDTHLPMRELYEALAALPCRHLLVILDCCFAGSFRWASRRPLSVPGEILYEERYRHWVRHPARWTLASAAHDQYSLDTLGGHQGQPGSHSPFATALLEGLAGEADTRPKGGDGIVTLAELYAYVQDRVAPHQSPLLSPLPGQTRGEFVFRDPHRARPLVSAEQVVHLDESKNPYRELKPYPAEHSELFFGREDATRQLLRRVRRHRLTVLVGPSGSGKSSLIQAGLLPLLRTRRQRRPQVGWQVPTPLEAGGDPFAGLREILVAAGGEEPLSAQELSENPEALRAWGAAWVASHPCERLLVVIDQAERLSMRVSQDVMEKPGDVPAASNFLACLGALLQTGDGRIRALVAVRSDEESDLDLTQVWSTSRRLEVLPLSREELRQVIEGPAARRALYFDDPRLVDRLVDEMVGMPGGLPLLSCVLSRLYLAYLRHGRGDRLLTALDLEEILVEIDGKPGARADSPVVEGILRVLRGAASRAVGELSDEAHQETLWRILLRLVDRVGHRTTRRQVSLRELEYPAEQESRRAAEMLERLVDQDRLLVRDRDPGAAGRASQSRHAVVELAHDKLVDAWPDFVQRIKDAQKFLPDHRHLTRAATAWVDGTVNARGEPRRGRDLDLRLLRVIEASGLPEDWLSRDETQYLAAARTERRRRTALLWSVTAATLILIVNLLGEAGYHRARTLPFPEDIVAPAGVGFAQDGRSPVLLNDRLGLVWNRESAELPLSINLPFNVLESVPGRRGEMVFRGLKEVAVAAFPSGKIRWSQHVPGQIEGLAFGAGTVAVSTENGDLYFFDDRGRRAAAPRPISQAGRRFPAFRETGPFVYGDVLALNQNYLATATPEGRLGILDRRTARFVVSSKPQFPLAQPIERVQDPILYETENTRPISDLVFLPHDQLLFAEGAGLRRIDLATGQLTALNHCEIELVRRILVLPDGQTIVALTSSTFEVLRFESADSNRLDCLQRTTLAPKSSPRAALAADGETVLIAFFDGEPELWQPGFKIFGVLLPFPRGI